MQKSERSSAIKSVLEVLSVVAPIICLVDCVVIPIAVAILPLVGLQGVIHGISDQFLALVVLIICAPVLVPGYFQHRRKRVLICMAAGFGLIFFVNFASNLIDLTVHTVLSLIGSSLLIKANWDNKRFSKSCHCHCEDHSAVAVPISIGKQKQELE